MRSIDPLDTKHLKFVPRDADTDSTHIYWRITMRKLIILAFACLTSVASVISAQAPPPAVMFTVASAGDSVVLVNITTGKSWLLLRSADKAREPVFVPIEQLNTEDEVHTWHALEESVATRHENSVEPTRSTTGDFKRHSFSWLAGRISHADAADFFIHYK